MKRRKIEGVHTDTKTYQVEASKPYKTRRANQFEIVEANNAKKHFMTAFAKNQLGTAHFIAEKSYAPYNEENLYHFLTLVLKHRDDLGHIPEYNTGDSSLDPLIYGIGERNRDSMLMKTLLRSNIYNCTTKIIQLNSEIKAPEFNTSKLIWRYEKHSELDTGPAANEDLDVNGEKPEIIIFASATKHGVPLMVMALAVRDYFGIGFLGVKYIPDISTVVLLFSGMQDIAFYLICVGTIEPGNVEGKKEFDKQRELHGHQDPFTFDINISAFVRPPHGDAALMLALAQARFHYINLGFTPIDPEMHGEDAVANKGRPRNLEHI